MNLQDQLAQFTGTQGYTRYPMTHLLFTEGAKHFNDVTPLVQDAAIAISFTPKLRNQEFLTITITSKNGAAKTVVDDGNDKVLYTQKYAFTDLEQGQYKLFATGGVLMLVSEY